MSDHSIVSDWLRTLGLGQYSEGFVDNGYDDLEICKQIGEPDLDAIGVADPAHRERILHAVRVLLEQGGTAVYFTLEEVNRNLRREISDSYESLSALSKLVVSSEQGLNNLSEPFENEYEEGRAELVKYPKMRLKMLLRDKLIQDGIRLSAQPFTNLDGSRGHLESLASRYAEDLRTHYQDVFERLEDLRKRRVAVDFPPQGSEVDGMELKPSQMYQPGRYLPSSCLNDREDDTVYGVYCGSQYTPCSLSSQRCLTSRCFYEPCPFPTNDHLKESDNESNKKKGGLSRLFRTLGSKKEKFRTSPRHLGRFKGGNKVTESSSKLSDMSPPPIQAGEVLGDENCVQLMLAVREGHMTMEQAVKRLSEFRQGLLWTKTMPKKGQYQGNSIFYTDSLMLACSTLRDRHHSHPHLIYYEPPDAMSWDTSTSSNNLSSHHYGSSRKICTSCDRNVAPSNFGTSQSKSASPTNSQSDYQPYSKEEFTSLILSRTSTSSTVVNSDHGEEELSTVPPVCKGKCGNIMCSVTASSDTPPSGSEMDFSNLYSSKSEMNNFKSGSVPDVARGCESNRRCSVGSCSSCHDCDDLRQDHPGGREANSSAIKPSGSGGSGMLGQLCNLAVGLFNMQ